MATIRGWTSNIGNSKPARLQAAVAYRVASLIRRGRLGFAVRHRISQRFGAELNQDAEEIQRLTAEYENRCRQGGRIDHKETPLLKRRALELSNLLFEASGGLQPTCYHVLAAESLIHGTNSVEVRRLSRTMSHLWTNQQSLVRWTGSLAQVDKALHFDDRWNQNLVTQTEQYLHRRGPHPTPLPELMQALGIEWRETARRKLVSAGLNLLDAAGLARKLPYLADRNLGAIGVWVHGAFENPAIRYRSVAFHVLRSLRAGARPLFELAESRGCSERNATEPDHAEPPSFPYNSVAATVAALRTSHLVRTFLLPGYARRPRVELTALGSSLLEAHERTGHLPEVLRQILLEGPRYWILRPPPT